MSPRRVLVAGIGNIFLSDDGFGVEVCIGNGWGPVAALSRSERLRVGAAVAAALCNLVGLRLLVIDDADALGPDEKGALLGWLQSLPFVKDRSGTVIVLSVLGEVEPADPGIEGLGIWTIEGGEIRRAPAAAMERA